MMSRTKRLSAAGSLEASRSSPVQTLKPAADDWTAWWSGIYAKGLCCDEYLSHSLLRLVQTSSISRFTSWTQGRRWRKRVK
jgi:hypothetical protein